MSETATLLPPQTRLDPLDRTLLRTIAMVLSFMAVLIVGMLIGQWIRYESATPISLRGAEPDHAAALDYQRALDFAATKLCALLLAFVVTFVGALYILRSSTEAFHLAVQGKGVGGTLQSTSPGLVMATLGVALAVVALLTRSNLAYDESGGRSSGISVEQRRVIDPPSVTPAKEGLAMEPRIKEEEK